MKNRGKSINHTQAVILFLILTVTLHILGLKVNGVIKGSDLISDYIDYGSKILGLFLVLHMVMFTCFTPMKSNLQALRCSGKESGEISLAERFHIASDRGGSAWFQIIYECKESGLS